MLLGHTVPPVVVSFVVVRVTRSVVTHPPLPASPLLLPSWCAPGMLLLWRCVGATVR